MLHLTEKNPSPNVHDIGWNMLHYKIKELRLSVILYLIAMYSIAYCHVCEQNIVTDRCIH